MSPCSIPLRYFLLFTLAVFACRSDKKSDHKVDRSPALKAYLDDYRPAEYKWGYIDLSGKEVIPAVYDDVRDFAGGLAAAKYRAYWGYINHEGEEVVESKYRAAYDFSEGCAIVQRIDKKYVVIDTLGKEGWVLPVDLIASRKEGIHRVVAGEYVYFVDQHGEEITDQKYDQGKDFCDGGAIVRIGENIGLLNKNGEAHLNIIYQNIKHLGDSLFRVEKDDRYLLYSTQTNSFLDEKYDDIYAYQNGFISINQNGNKILFDLNSKKTIAQDYALFQPANEGLWLVYDGEKWGILDESGNLLLPPAYPVIYKFHNGRSGFMYNDRWGYLGVNGKVAIPPIFPLVWDFKGDLARAIMDRGVGFIDKLGKTVINPSFIEVRDFYEGKARYQKYR